MHMWAHTRYLSLTHTCLYTKQAHSDSCQSAPGCHGNSFPVRCGEKWDVSSVRTDRSVDDWRLAVIWLLTAKNLVMISRRWKHCSFEFEQKMTQSTGWRTRRLEVYVWLANILPLIFYCWVPAQLCSGQGPLHRQYHHHHFYSCVSRAPSHRDIPYCTVGLKKFKGDITKKTGLHHREDFLCEFDAIMKLIDMILS